MSLCSRTSHLADKRILRLELSSYNAMNSVQFGYPSAFWNPFPHCGEHVWLRPDHERGEHAAAVPVCVEVYILKYAGVPLLRTPEALPTYLRS